MKKYIISILVVLLAGLIFFSFSDAHINRNQYNFLPSGKLVRIADNQYQDEAGLTWVLQPHSKNIFHQPDSTLTIFPANPYPLFDYAPTLDKEHPNLKLLCPLPNDASYEAILQPDGTYLTNGSKQGTYNYGHPEGIWGNTRHLFWDVVPHFVNSNYK